MPTLLTHTPCRSIKVRVGPINKSSCGSFETALTQAAVIKEAAITQAALIKGVVTGVARDAVTVLITEFSSVSLPHIQASLLILNSFFFLLSLLLFFMLVSFSLPTAHCRQPTADSRQPITHYPQPATQSLLATAPCPLSASLSLPLAALCPPSTTVPYHPLHTGNVSLLIDCALNGHLGFPVDSSAGQFFRIASGRGA